MFIYYTINIYILETRGILNPKLLNNKAEKIKIMVSNTRTLPGIICVSTLAHYGLLGSGINDFLPIILSNIDLTSVPAEHLASLVSCVRNLKGCDLVSLLDSVKSSFSWMNGQSLSSEETKALVRAMESNVETGYRSPRSRRILEHRLWWNSPERQEGLWWNSPERMVNCGICGKARAEQGLLLPKMF